MAKKRVEGLKRKFSRSHVSGLGLLVFVVGLFWLAKDLEWIPIKISIWPVLFIVFGLYWFIKSLTGRG